MTQSSPVPSDAHWHGAKTLPSNSSTSSMRLAPKSPLATATTAAHPTSNNSLMARVSTSPVASSSESNTAWIGPKMLVATAIVCAVFTLAALGIFIRHRWRNKKTNRSVYVSKLDTSAQVHCVENPFASPRNTVLSVSHISSRSSTSSVSSVGRLGSAVDTQPMDPSSSEQDDSYQVSAGASSVGPPPDYSTPPTPNSPAQERGVGMPLFGRSVLPAQNSDTKSRNPSPHWPASSSNSQARPLGPRGPLLTYAELFNNSQELPSAEDSNVLRPIGLNVPTQPSVAHHRQAEDGGISLAGGPLHVIRRDRDADGGVQDASEHCDMQVDAESLDRYTCSDGTLPPEYREY
ncbi:hypothetical protein DAEQUDRAFT_731869 [Daedalea quercina L-15889]|uniref:Uncharacterized protein n=1 Tax=Daedalea quercina L-15889 TaxID=1314783 RepID=A0A165LYQ9_9APHY|nr:hypothetical protein DAEQUDRAFT_731869 [Daedalea quercina L-15889]